MLLREFKEGIKIDITLAPLALNYPSDSDKYF
jgi:hypothetical protein